MEFGKIQRTRLVKPKNAGRVPHEQDLSVAVLERDPRKHE
jgi:hypothetical protein